MCPFSEVLSNWKWGQGCWGQQAEGKAINDKHEINAEILSYFSLKEQRGHRMDLSGTPWQSAPAAQVEEINTNTVPPFRFVFSIRQFNYSIADYFFRRPLKNKGTRSVKISDESSQSLDAGHYWDILLFLWSISPELLGNSSFIHSDEGSLDIWLNVSFF